ncbi:TRAPP subunit [Martiniozyma asiatica (nom. inval.)]|nr:TRAPP subunit [Martiniozyma asiatica]
MSYYICVLGTTDCPLYELQVNTPIPAILELRQFIANAALDVLPRTSALFYPNVDIFYGYSVNIFHSQAGTKFVILSDSKSIEIIRLFCIELHEIYVKRIMSPFYKINSPLSDSSFDSQVRALVKKHL